MADAPQHQHLVATDLPSHPHARREQARQEVDLDRHRLREPVLLGLDPQAAEVAREHERVDPAEA
jgi:hypothetical protein